MKKTSNFFAPKKKIFLIQSFSHKIYDQNYTYHQRRECLFFRLRQVKETAFNSCKLSKVMNYFGQEKLVGFFFNVIFFPLNSCCFV